MKIEKKVIDQLLNMNYMQEVLVVYTMKKDELFV